MTLQEKQQLLELSKKFDTLPDEIIRRLDDRYLKKDDADERLITRRETRVFNVILSMAVIILGLWTALKEYFTN